MSESVVKINSIYQHYKGGLYKVVGIAKDGEDLKDIVVYENIETSKLWTRSLSNFVEVLGDDREGTHYHRFSSIDISCVAWECLSQSLNWKCDTHIIADELINELNVNIREIARTIRNTCIHFEFLKNASILIKPVRDYKYLEGDKYYPVEQWFDVFGEVGFSGYVTVKVSANANL